MKATKRKDGRWQASKTIPQANRIRKKLYVYGSTKSECLNRLYERMGKGE